MRHPRHAPGEGEGKEGDGDGDRETDVGGGASGELEFHFCGRCGCVTHWWVKGERERGERVGVNVRMLGERYVRGLEERRSWGPGT